MSPTLRERSWRAFRPFALRQLQRRLCKGHELIINRVEELLTPRDSGYMTQDRKGLEERLCLSCFVFWIREVDRTQYRLYQDEHFVRRFLDLLDGVADVHMCAQLVVDLLNVSAPVTESGTFVRSRACFSPALNLVSENLEHHCERHVLN